MSLEQRWQSLWTDAGGASHDYASYVYRRLALRYTESHRFYHTLAHILHGLRELDPADVIVEAVDPHAVKMALWFHDVVYDPRRHDNEQRSTEIASTLLETGGFRAEFVDRVATLVLATAHAGKPKDDDEALLIDIDLAILGQPPERFDEYERLIRAEYSFVPEEVYCSARAKILRRFFERSYIYYTAPMRRRYEKTAEHNLKNSIECLTGRPF